MSQCTHCSAENKPGARFCAACGRPLPLTATNTPTEPLQARRPNAATTKLGGLPRATPLAVDALLDEDRFRVVLCVPRTPAHNSYLVADRTLRCPTCGRDYPPGARFCDADGATLEAGPGGFAVVEEYFDPRGLAPAEAAARVHLDHPRAINVRRTFALPAAGGERTYVLKDAVLVDAPAGAAAAYPQVLAGRRLAAQGALPPAQAAAVAADVAAVLDALADAGAALAELTPAHVVTVGGGARLDLEAAPGVQPMNRARGDALHVQALARFLRQVSAGQPWPPRAASLFDQAERGEAPERAAGFAAVLGSYFRAAPAPVSAPVPAPVPAAPPARGAAPPVAAAPAVPTVPPAALPAVAVGKLTDVGLVREINEDSLIALELDQFHNSVNTPLRLYAVADGMGGHAAGEVASKLALEALRDEVIRGAGQAAGAADLGALLVRAGQAAARAVAEQAQRTQSDMGTTLVAALVDTARMAAHAINVGDSRLYKLDAAAIRQVTKDHSLVQRLVDAGTITPAEARHHPNSNLIFRTLGAKPNVEIDRYDEPLAPGDFLLLCSDGLCGLVDDPDLHAAVAGAPSPQAACARLIELAKEAGGHDNISAIVVGIAGTRPAAVPPAPAGSAVTQKLSGGSAR